MDYPLEAAYCSVRNLFPRLTVHCHIMCLSFTEEDEFGTYATIVLKHYLAEGAVNDHSLLLASHDTDTKKLVRLISISWENILVSLSTSYVQVAELPSPLIGNSNQGSHNDDGDQLRIAWRYQDLPSDELPTNIPIFGNTYNLGLPMMKSKLDKIDINHWDPHKS